MIRIRPGLGAEGGGDGVELPQTPPCGPQFGVRRINLFRVGGREANGPMGSRCCAEGGESPSARGLLSSLFVSSLFVSSSYYPAFFLTDPGRGIYFRCSL